MYRHRHVAAGTQARTRARPHGLGAGGGTAGSFWSGAMRCPKCRADMDPIEYDGVVIGGYINGQDAVNFPATEETTVWFNRVLNIIHANAPKSKIILVRGPEDVVPAIERVLGKNPQP